MKKKLTLAIAAILCISFLAACGGGTTAAPEDAFVGTWTMTNIEMGGEVIMDMADYEDLGISSTLTFNADMTVEYNMMGEVISGTWETADGTAYTMNFEAEGETFAMSGAIDGDTLFIEEAEGKMNFVRGGEAVAPIEDGEEPAEEETSDFVQGGQTGDGPASLTTEYGIGPLHIPEGLSYEVSGTIYEDSLNVDIMNGSSEEAYIYIDLDSRITSQELAVADAMRIPDGQTEVGTATFGDNTFTQLRYEASYGTTDSYVLYDANTGLMYEFELKLHSIYTMEDPLIIELLSNFGK